MESALIDFIHSQSGTAALLIAALGGVCAWVAAVMPAPNAASGVLYKALYTVINWIGANIGKAENADDAAKRQGTLR